MDEDHEEKNSSYAWEAEYKRTWDVLQEDEQGQLKIQRQRKVQPKQIIKRGLIRQLVVIVDCSSTMAEKDLRPSRLEHSLLLMKDFVVEFFDQNPLSLIMVIGMRDGIGERLTNWSGSPTELCAQIDVRMNPSGDPSLQNALEMAHQALAFVPTHVSKECLIIMGSLYTVDPGDIQETFDTFQRQQIIVNAIGLSASMAVLSKISKATNGMYEIITSEAHYRELWGHITVPPPLLNTAKNKFMEMGFPAVQVFDYLTLCACHGKAIGNGNICPRCFATICEIPRECPICSLVLVSAPALARSYHHLFPVELFTTTAKTKCFVCQGSGTLKCKCGEVFCEDCDAYIHDVLHSCPGCI